MAIRKLKIPFQDSRLLIEIWDRTVKSLEDDFGLLIKLVGHDIGWELVWDIQNSKPH
jgi:hypothetical protein